VIPRRRGERIHPTVSDSHGPITGNILSDDSFTLPAFVQGLATKPTIVLLATHFIHETGNKDNHSEANYLVPTDAKDPTKTRGLSVADFPDSSNLDLSGVELLTLSACSTGQSNEISSMQDVDSLAMVLRRRGAAAVLAPLWKTDDTASLMFMSSFYTLWASHPNLGKLEACGQTQLKMLNGEMAGGRYAFRV
jgi:CHAT domain-containing protein